MKTDDLITMIANQAGPAPKVSVTNRLVPAGIGGGLIAAAIVLGVLGLIPGDMFSEPGPWIKIGYASTLAIAAGWLFARLGKPGASGKQATSAVVGVVMIMLIAGVLSYLGTPASERACRTLGAFVAGVPMGHFGVVTSGDGRFILGHAWISTNQADFCRHGLRIIFWLSGGFGLCFGLHRTRGTFHRCLVHTGYWFVRCIGRSAWTNIITLVEGLPPLHLRQVGQCTVCWMC